MRVGGDLFAAFGLALGVHAALGLTLGLPGGQAGTDTGPAIATAALAPADAAALVQAWRAPPVAQTTPTASVFPVPANAAPAAPARSRDRAVSRAAMTAPGTPRTPSAPPQVEAPQIAPVAVADNVDLPAAPPVAVERPVHVASDRAGALSREAPGKVAPAPPAGSRPTPDAPPPSTPVAARPEKDTQRPKPRPEPGAIAAAAARAPSAEASPLPRSHAGAASARPAETRRLKAAWAGAIGARIARAQRHPGVEFGSGRVRVTLVVARDGRLGDVRVAASSGSAHLDRAAVAAVRRAAPFPEAPGGLAEEWVRFGQWVSFR